MLPFLARLAPPLAAYLAMLSYAAQEVSAAAAAETAALAFYAAVVLLAVAALARPGAAEALLGCALATAAVWVLPHGPLREGVLGALLVAVFAVAAARRLALDRGGAGGLTFAVALPLALGTQALLRSVVLLPPQLGDLGWRTPVIVVVLPAAAAVALAVLAGRLGTGLALAAGGIAALLGPGWNVKTTLALLFLAALALAAEQWLPAPGRLPAGSRRGLALLGGAAAALLFVAALLTAPPWLRAEPAATFLRPPALPRPSTTPLAGVVTLAVASPAWEAAIPAGAPLARLVVLDSALANSAPLERGAPVATVTLREAAGGVRRFALRAGIETGEWSAGRPDVAARLHAGAPEPWLSWIVGDYMARRYRARWVLPAPAAVTGVRIERAAGLPTDVSLSIHHLELRP